MSPKISIITPVLNMTEHIAGCIQSVQEQGAEVEHIIVDGGSTDGTLEAINNHQHPGLTVISEPDEGQSDAINKGLKMATGEVFNWLNADDRLKPNALSAVAELFEPKEINVVLGKCEHINSESSDVEAVGQTFYEGRLAGSMANYAMAQPSHFYRTEMAKALGGLNTSLHYVMDMDLWFRYLLNFGVDGVEKTESVLTEFWLHPHAKSSAQADAMKREKYAVFSALLESLGAPEVVLEMVRHKADPATLEYDTPILDLQEFLSEFSWHLLLEAYEKGDLDSAEKLLELVLIGNRLDAKQAAIWKLRVTGATGQLVKKLRGK